MLQRAVIAGLILAATIIGAGAAIAAQDNQDNDEVIRRGDFTDDLFLAGGRVELEGRVKGDVFATGGWVEVDADITDDLIAAGGNLTLTGSAEDIFAAGGRVRVNAKVADNLVATGGWLDIAGNVSGKLIAAGGNLDLDSGLNVTSDAMLAGGEVSLAGRFEGDVSVASGELTVSPDTEIAGQLTYRGSEEPTIPAGAQIAGGVEFERVEGMPDPGDWMPMMAVGGVVSAVMWILGLSVLGAIVYLLFPRFFTATERSLTGRPWASLGLGLAVLAATPIVIVLLFVTVIGILPGVILIPVYGLALVLGYLTAIIATARHVAERAKSDMPSRGLILAFLVGTVIVFTIIAAIPLLGGLFNFIVLLLGMGALILTGFRNWRGEEASPSQPTGL